LKEGSGSRAASEEHESERWETVDQSAETITGKVSRHNSKDRRREERLPTSGRDRTNTDEKTRKGQDRSRVACKLLPRGEVNRRGGYSTDAASNDREIQVCQLLNEARLASGARAQIPSENAIKSAKRRKGGAKQKKFGSRTEQVPERVGQKPWQLKK